MKLEPVAVVVAKAKVKGAAKIEVQPLAEVKAKVKQPIHVKYLYRLEELSKDKESWRFQLNSALGDQKQAPASAQWDDRWGRNDSLWGVLQQEYSFEAPGTYEGTFDVHAEHSETKWRGKEPAKTTEKSANGTFRVTVVR